MTMTLPPATAALAAPGELDVCTLPRFAAQLREAVQGRPQRLVVDLTDCAFIDAGSIGTLLEAHRALARAGGELVLQGCSARVLRVLSLTGLGRVFSLA